jgi:putative membrane protein
MKQLIRVLTLVFAIVTLMSTGCARIAEMRQAGNPGDVFLSSAAKASASEIKISELARERSANPEVKRYAERIIADHEKMNQDIRRFAERRGTTVSMTPDEMHAMTATHVSKLSGDQFDREYMTEMAADHAKLAIKFEGKSRQDEDREIQQWAASQLPIFREHFQMAQRISQQLYVAP